MDGIAHLAAEEHVEDDTARPHVDFWTGVEHPRYHLWRGVVG
jgi:hypothetical protein